MRDLLGGKGANVAEMTRILGHRSGPGRLHDHDRGVRRLHARRGLPRRSRRPDRRGACGARGARRQEARRPRGPAARLRALGRARVDARHARHRPEPRPQRRVGAGSGDEDRERTLRVGLLPALRADVRQRRARHRGPALPGRDQARQVRPRRQGRHGARRRGPAGAHARLQGALRVPHRAARAARAGHPGRLRLLERRARAVLPAHQPHPRRLGHGGQRAADGLRQQGRRQRLGRRLQPRRGHGRAGAQRRLPHQRPGRGRRLGRAQHARHRRSRPGAARGPRAADGDPARARAPLRRHAGHRVHGRRGPAVHAADAQRQAPGAGGRALRGRRGGRGAARQGPGAADDRSRDPRRTAASDLRPAGRVRRAGLRRGRLAGRRGRARSSSPPPMRCRRPPTGATSSSRGRSPRPTTSRASTRRRGS